MPVEKWMTPGSAARWTIREEKCIVLLMQHVPIGIFTMSYCGVNLKPAFECTDYPTSSGSAQQRCEAGNTLKDGFEYVYNTGRYKAYSECSSRDCWCCRRST
ncbi:unnamed protein product, partial [Effrenium voratum]